MLERTHPVQGLLRELLEGLGRAIAVVMFVSLCGLVEQRDCREGVDVVLVADGVEVRQGAVDLATTGARSNAETHIRARTPCPCAFSLCT